MSHRPSRAVIKLAISQTILEHTLKGLGDEIPLHEMFPVGAFGILESTIDKVYNDAEKDAEKVELKRVRQLADKQKEISSRESNNETTTR